MWFLFHRTCHQKNLSQNLAAEISEEKWIIQCFGSTTPSPRKIHMRVGSWGEIRLGRGPQKKKQIPKHNLVRQTRSILSFFSETDVHPNRFQQGCKKVTKKRICTQTWIILMTKAGLGVQRGSRQLIWRLNAVNISSGRLFGVELKWPLETSFLCVPQVASKDTSWGLCYSLITVLKSAHWLSASFSTTKCTYCSKCLFLNTLFNVCFTCHVLGNNRRELHRFQKQIK